LWKAGAKMGVTDNGHAIGVISGIGKIDCYVGGGKLIGDVIKHGNGESVYSNVENDTTTSEFLFESCMWKAGAIVGITDNGHAIGVISGTGKIDCYVGGGKLTGDVTADGKGGCNYVNVENDTTTSEFLFGSCMWKAGAIVGITANGHAIGVISGIGKLDYFASGAHVTGDVAANGKGGYVYSNVENDTTKSEYWDGTRMWKAGAILGITDKGRGIGVLSGTRKSD
jgi:hypothetical protein